MREHPTEAERAGPYGSRPLLSETPWCNGPLSEFGARGILHEHNACSPDTDDPPVIVDHGGTLLRRLLRRRPDGTRGCGLPQRKPVRERQGVPGGADRLRDV